MLDDLKYIHQRDKGDALGVAQKQWQQLTYDFQFQVEDTRQIINVVYAGMGGSALAALLVQSCPGLGVPFEVNRQYHVPDYVNEKTLFIACSYSGNTEETIVTLEEARSRGAQIVIITGGGKLLEIAEANKYPLLLLPKAGQPRYAVFYNYRGLIEVLSNYGLVDDAIINDLHQVADFLQLSSADWLPTVSTNNNPAKLLAQEIVGLSVVIYAGPLLKPAAYKWKISCNENAKNVAWWGEFPEFNHNEFIGWSGNPVDKLYAIINLQSRFEHERINRRMELSERMLSGKKPAAHNILAQGDTPLTQLLWTVLFGDFVTLYLALLNNVDPTPVALVERFKNEL